MWKQNLYSFLLVLPYTCAIRIVVKECPVTETAWKARSQIFTCKSPSVYHCIQDQTRNLMETCMIPYHIKPFYEDGCPWALHFTDGDSLLGSVFYPCSETDCPRKNDSAYWSNQLYKYPICLHYMQTTYITDSTTPISIKHTVATYNVNESAEVIIGIVATAVAMIILWFVTVLIWKHRRRLNSCAGFDEEADGIVLNTPTPAARTGFDEEADGIVLNTPTPADISKEEDNKKSGDNFSTELHSLCMKGDFMKVEHLIHKTQKGFNTESSNGRSLLHSAGFSGSVKLVQYFIDNGCDMYKQDNIGQTVIHIACQGGHVDLVKHLVDIDKGVLDLQDNSGLTPLHCAGFSGSLQLVSYLINYCCDVYRKRDSGKTFAHNVSNKEHDNLEKHLINKDKAVLDLRNKNGWTPFHCAGFSGSVELVQYLIDNDCDVNSQDYSGWTIAHIACQKGHADLVKYLVKKNKGVLNTKDNNGKTSFHFAGFSGSVELVQYLIDNGCDVYSKDNNGCTIVHIACKKGHIDLVKYLVSKHKDVLNIKNEKGLTPFHFAGFSGSVELVQYLIDNGGDVCCKSNSGRTIVHVACHEGHVDLVKYLIGIDKGVLNLKHKSGLTPFHFAGYSGSVKLVQYLIDKGCDVYSGDDTGWTIVHYACQKGHVKLLKHLIEKDKGVLNIKDNNGLTPFHCAGFSGSVELVQYLIDNGCDVYSKDNDGRTIVHNAFQKGYVNLVKHLVDKNIDLLKIKDKNGITPELSASSELLDYLRNAGCE